MALYGMFTTEGSAEVAKIVTTVLAENDNFDAAWKSAEEQLTVLSRNPMFGEALDTAVRDNVYVRLEMEYRANG